MFEIARYETERRFVGALAVSVGLSLLAVMFLALGPQVLDEVDLDELATAYPESLQNAFGIDAIGTFAGFLATELYQFAWVIVLGLYFAYVAGSTVAGDVERERMDLLLATPISRSSVVVEKYLGIVPSILIVNVVVGSVVYVGAILVGEALPFVDVLAVHALSLPYFLACASIGLLFSVLLDRESTAQRAGMGAVFGLFMLEAAVTGTAFEGFARLSPTRYYDPTEVLVDGTYDLVGATILLEVAVLLLIVSVLWFQRRDV